MSLTNKQWCVVFGLELRGLVVDYEEYSLRGRTDEFDGKVLPHCLIP